MILLLLACRPQSSKLDDSSSDTGSYAITDYQVLWSTDPDPLVAGEQGEFNLQVLDQEGRPVENLQQNHERMVHTIFVSADWASFTHTHHEDYAELSVENLRDARFEFPLTLPLSGSYFAMFDFAHQDEWLQRTDYLEVSGEPAQQSAPDTTPTDSAQAEDLLVTLSWDVLPATGIEVAWTVSIQDSSGQDVTDLTQYLAADGHCAMVDQALSWGRHTHAWFPGVDDMAPSMEMPHQYSGPTLPFHYVFPAAGAYKMWVQFARESAPGVVYTAPFVFEVEG